MKQCLASLWLAIFSIESAAAVELPQVLDKRLTIELIAAEPAIVTPTGIAVDAQGWVLVIESHTHFRPADYAGPPADRIRLFRPAANGDDTPAPTTFFEGTQATMNLGVHPDGSTFVATRMEVFRLNDRDHDQVAEERTPIAHLETAGNYPHNGLSGFAFDFAGNVYFGLGENLGADYRLVGSDGTALSGGGEGGSIYRCRPDGSGLARLATGFWNPFHLAFDAFERLFAVDNDPDSRPPCRLLHIVPDGDYGYRFRNGRKGLHPFTAWNGELPGTLPMTAGTGEAPSGVVAYESDGLPGDYRGTLMVTAWGDHRIEGFRLERRGASFRAVAEPIIIGGENFRPVGIAVAPDGALYVSDWVDKSYTLHGQGRIWRIRGSDAAPSAGVAADTSKGSAGNPLTRIHSPRRDQREPAARQLAQGTAEDRAALRALLRTDDDPRVRAVAILALAAVSELTAADADAALADASADVRGLALRHVSVAPALLINLAQRDASAEVRAEALRRLAEAPPSDDWAAVLLAACREQDPFLRQAAIMALARSQTPDGLLKLSQTVDALGRLGVLLALRQQGASEAASAVGAFLRDPDPTVRFAAVEWVAEQGLVDFRPQIAQGLASGGTTRALFEAYLAALERLDGVRRQGLKDDVSGETYVAQLLFATDTAPVVRRRALRVLRPDHPDLTLDRLRALLATGDLELECEAVRTLRESPHHERTELLAATVENATLPTLLRAEAIVGLDAGETTQRKLLITLATSADEPSLRDEALRTLQGAMLAPGEREKLVQLATALDQREPAAARLARRVLDPAGVESQPPLDDLDAWLALVATPGDAAAGERIFFHARGAGCFRCHQVDGRGGNIGPDLSSLAQVMPRRRIVESIVQPSKEIAPQFVPWTIARSDGRVETGVLLAEAADGVQTFADAKGQVFSLARGEIAERHPGSKSIMPDGLGDRLTIDELRHLLAYLQTRR